MFQFPGNVGGDMVCFCESKTLVCGVVKHNFLCTKTLLYFSRPYDTKIQFLRSACQVFWQLFFKRMKVCLFPYNLTSDKL